MEFLLGLSKIAKGHTTTTIRVGVGDCTHKLTQVTSNKISVLKENRQDYVMLVLTVARP